MMVSTPTVQITSEPSTRSNVSGPPVAFECSVTPAADPGKDAQIPVSADHIDENSDGEREACGKKGLVRAFGQMRAQNPETVLVLSKLLPISPQNFTQPIADNIGKLNTAMEKFVKDNTSQKSPIVLVDQNTGFDYKTMTRDGEHPNEAGDKFMADRFFQPVKDALVVSSVQKLMLRDEAIGFKGV